MDTIHKKYGPMIGRVASSFADGADREDLEQEIMLALIRALPSFRGESQRKTFIYRIAQNCGVNFLRKRRVDETFDDAIDARDPETIVTKKQQYELLAAAIRTLPLSLRQPIVLRMEGLSYDEISEILGITTSLVGVRIHRATEALKAKKL